MTPRQRQALTAIKRLTVDGVAPTFEELRVECGFGSKAEVHRIITALERQGIIRRPTGGDSGRKMARAIEIVRYDGEITDSVLDAMPRHQLWSLHARVWSRLEASQ